MKRTFLFNKNEKGEWWLELPEWKGDPEDLQMVEGADQWLDMLSQKHDQLRVVMSDEKIEGAEILTLLRVREENLGGGGIYYLETYQKQKVGMKLWLCEVTSFIFDYLPQRIYFKIKN